MTKFYDILKKNKKCNRYCNETLYCYIHGQCNYNIMKVKNKKKTRNCKTTIKKQEDKLVS